MAIAIIQPSSLIPVKLGTQTISGVVRDANSTPVAREVVVLKSNYDTVLGRAVSDETTGAYSIEVVGGSTDRFLVCVFGESTEYSKAKGNILGII